jgi:hypothetical protein
LLLLARLRFEYAPEADGQLCCRSSVVLSTYPLRPKPVISTFF